MTTAADGRESRDNASEIKFYVDTAAADRLRERIRQLLSPDPFASGPNADEYATATLYFDTTGFAVYARRGSYRRAKYRVRRYGSGDMVFLERKLRTADYVSKRRTSVRIEDLPLLTSADPVGDDWTGSWFHQRLRMRRLGAVCQINYRRTARVGMTDYGPIRLTIDQHLCGRATERPEFQAPGAGSLTANSIVEMKFRSAMPTVFKQIVEEFALRPERISKYRLGVEATRPDVAAAIAEQKTAALAARTAHA